MAGEYISGQNDSTVKARRLQESTSSYDSVSEAAAYEYYTVGPDYSGSKGSGTSFRTRVPERVKAPAREGKKADRPEERDALRRFWEEAEVFGCTMEGAARDGDAIEIANSATDLIHKLNDLWKLRHVREEDWAGILNFLQGVLLLVRREKRLEFLSVDQCHVIKDIVTNYLGPATVDKDDVRSCIRILKEAGFDPWGPIAGSPES